MEKKWISKKEIKSSINNAFESALASLDLPAPTKKIKKLLHQNSKKLALVFTEILKKEDKKKKKALRKAGRGSDKKKAGKRKKGEIITNGAVNP